jgi:hypothetical protein
MMSVFLSLDKTPTLRNGFHPIRNSREGPLASVFMKQPVSAGREAQETRKGISAMQPFRDPGQNDAIHPAGNDQDRGVDVALDPRRP